MVSIQNEIGDAHQTPPPQGLKAALPLRKTARGGGFGVRCQRFDRTLSVVLKTLSQRKAGNLVFKFWGV